MNNNLETYTNEQLLKELQDRKERFAAQQPLAVENPDFSRLIKACWDNIAVANRGDGVSGANEIYTYEIAMKCVFGDDIFKWIDANRK